MQIRKILSMLILTALTAGCVSQPQAQGDASPAVEPSAANAKSAIVAAKASLKKAGSVQATWRDSGKLVKKAEAAVKKGDFAGAIKLADRAADEGAMAYKQGADQKELYIPPYLMSKY
ncbi:MAG: hypothetical protein ABW185_10160 [Sedimenticola sp.]